MNKQEEDAVAKTSMSNGDVENTTKEKNKSDSEKESPAKIFIGNIPTDLIGQNNLDEIFGPYGEIVGISMHQGFAFVLFKQESSAKEAIKGELDRIIAGRKIDICTANEAIERGKNVSLVPYMRRDVRRPPLPPHPMMMPMAFRRDFPPPPIGMLPHNMGPGSLRPPVNRLPPTMKNPLEAAKMNMEAKVICSERHPQLLGYAQMLNHRIKRLGLGCDIFFLDPLSSHEMAINRAAKDGVLYVIFVKPENELHLSVTLYILHGQAQEHRNMPLDDCFKLVAANFDKYLRTLKQEVETTPPEDEAATGIIGDIDPNISLLLLNLAEGKSVNLKQIDLVLNHVLKVRDALTGSNDSSRFKEVLERLKNGDANSVAPSEPKTDPKQQANDLQAKIKQLFGDSNKQLSTVGVPNPPPSSKAPGNADKKPSFDFTNPNVQDALKKLLKSSTNILTKVRANTSPEKSSQPDHFNSKKPKLMHTEGNKIPTIGQYQPSTKSQQVPVAQQQIPTLQGRRKSPRHKQVMLDFQRERLALANSETRSPRQLKNDQPRYASPCRDREYKSSRETEKESYILKNQNKERIASPSRERGRYGSPSDDRNRYLLPNHEREKFISPSQDRRMSPNRERERYTSPGHSRERDWQISPGHGSREKDRQRSPGHGSRDRERYNSPEYGSHEKLRQLSPSGDRLRQSSPGRGRRRDDEHHYRERERGRERQRSRSRESSRERLKRAKPGRPTIAGFF